MKAMAPPTARLDKPESLGWVLMATVASVTVGSVALLVVPGFQFVVVAPSLDIVLNTVATLVAGTVAGLGWIRFQEHGRADELLQGGAFLVLFASGFISVAAPIVGFGRGLGMVLESPGQAPLYIWGIGRLIAAITLAVAGTRLRDRLPGGAGASFVALIPLVVFGAAIGVIVGAGSRLPDLIGPEGMLRLQDDPVVPSALPGVTVLGFGLQLIGSALFILAAALNVRRYREDGRVGPAYLAVGLVVAAFSQLHSAIYPGTYTSLVTTGDVLRLAFYAILFLGIQAETRADLRALLGANRRLETLRETEAVRASLEERARLAREIHDGLAQELWFAKLKIERLGEVPSLDAESAALVAEVTTAVDRGLADARQAVIAMRTDVDGGTLADVLGRYVEEFGDSSGLRVDFTSDATLPTLSARRQAELLRVTQEALNNVRKHADATVVHVTITCVDGHLRISIADNGRGFQPEVEIARGFGLQSMLERAEAIGGQLVVTSRIQDGTTVAVSLPLDGAGRA